MKYYEETAIIVRGMLGCIQNATDSDTRVYLYGQIMAMMAASADHLHRLSDEDHADATYLLRDVWTEVGDVLLGLA